MEGNGKTDGDGRLDQALEKSEALYSLEIAIKRAIEVLGEYETNEAINTFFK